MTVSRIAIIAAGVATGLSVTPASAQFFMQSPDLSGPRVKGDEPGIGERLPGATAAELRAGLIWNMRAALNVAALQCQFEPTLLTVSNYNAILADHKDELKSSFDVLDKYFTRTAKSKPAGQKALDTYGTRTYSSFTAVAGQYGFCQTANAIGRDAIFTPRGGFGEIAESRMRELRNSLIPFGEQRFPHYINRGTAPTPRLDAVCWSKKGEWVTKKCGAQNWPPAGVGIATR